MSTDFEYKCKTCNEYSSTWFQSGAELLRKLWIYRKEFIAVKVILQREDMWWITFQITKTDTSDDCPLDWLEKHHEHQVIIVDEYKGEYE